MWLWILVIGIAVLALAVGAALAYGAWRWRRATGERIERLETGRQAPGGAPYDERQLDGLPEPVVRYFRAVLTPGTPRVAGARLVQEAEFRTGEDGDAWQRCSAREVFSVRPAGFVWDARIRLAPGVLVYVRDGYVAGAGFMHGELLGLVTVADARDSAELRAGALHRYLAEAVWLPTALLPRPGLRWSAIDDSRALATLSEAGTTVSLQFGFNERGEITRAFTPHRYREVRGGFEPTPWEGRFADYGDRDGMRIPLRGEVAWQLAEGRYTYWRGRLKQVSYT